MNKGVFDGTREYDQYMMYRGLQANMRRMAARCGNNYELYNLTTKDVVKPVVNGHDTLKAIMSHEQQATDEEILEEFKDVGKQYGETVLVNATTKEEKLIQVAPNRK